MNALSGSLSHFQPSQVLRLLQMTSASGCLHVRHADEHADLYVQNGSRLLARTNGISLRTGDLLVDRGEIRPQVLELAIAIQQDRPGKRLGELLVESGAVDAASVSEAVLDVQRRIVCRVLLWQDGVFAFRPGQMPQEAAENSIDLDLEEILSYTSQHVGQTDPGDADRHAA